MWSPISSILVHGERDAILVDTPTIAAQAVALADWVEKGGKILSHPSRLDCRALWGSARAIKG
jgi:hypothetical protein